MLLELSHISKRFGQVEAVHTVSFGLPEGEHLALLGESGSGKSTLLRLIAGFETPDSGEIRLNSRIISSEKLILPPHLRGIGMIFQDNALFPHLNVAENIGFGVDKSRRSETVSQLLSMIGLEGMGKRFPHELSGGQQQRVAIARSLATAPELLLLDEPFSSLDPSIRYQVRDESFQLLNRSGIASILVTHDIEDALAFSQRLMVIRHGSIVQDGSAKELFDQPATAYVAGLFGPINRLEQNDEKLRYFRPEDARLEEGMEGKWAGIVEKTVFHGRKHRLYISGEGFTFTVDSDRNFSVGTRLQVIPEESAVKTTRP